jgi:hypothetical protein
MSTWDGEERRSSNLNIVISITELQKDIKNLSGKVDQFLDDQKEIRADVRVLKDWRNGIVAVIGVFAFMATLFATSGGLGWITKL